MKHFFKIFLVVCLLTISNTGFSQLDSVTNTITNFNISGGTTFSFDIYTLRTSEPVFPMGNSSYFVSFNAGRLNNPRLSNINPKYTIGSLSSSYNPMGVELYPFVVNNKVGVQVYYVGGAGEIITDDPGALGLGERIATVTMDIISSDFLTDTTKLKWDTVNSDVVSTNFRTAVSNWDGSFTGVLPVELSAFTSTVNFNNVNLRWTTTAEVNNSGFEIERKSVNGGNNGWNRIAFVEGKGNSQEVNNYSYTDKGLQTGKYNYRLKQVDFNGNFEYFDLANEIVIGVPDKFELIQNYPNPFNPSTSISFSLPEDSKVSLTVFDISGRLVSTLINNEFKSANYYTVSFNASGLSSGSYFYRIQTEKNTDTKKMLLIK